MLLASILLAATALLVFVVHRTTSGEFVDVQREESQIDLHSNRVNTAVSVLEVAYSASGAAGLVAASHLTGDGSLVTKIPFVVLSPGLEVLATTESPLMNAAVSRSNDGGLTLVVKESPNGEVLDIEISTSSPRKLYDHYGELFGELIVLPESIKEESGVAFSYRVWANAAPWLLTVLTGAVLLTVLVLHRALEPIVDLTRAAATLKDGEFPEALEIRGGSTEFDELISTFNSASSALARTDDIRRQLISDIAHELRTPVTNIKGQLEAMKAGLVKADEEFTDTLKAETRLLERLVKDFQEIAVSDAGQLRLTLQLLPLRETVDNMLRPMAQQAGAMLDNTIAQEIVIVADEERVRQILTNLFDNSRREQHGCLKILVSAEKVGAMVQLRFEDNGPGIAPVDQPHVFERFFRADKSRNRSTGGAGLGLAIIKGLVTAMGGDISCTRATIGGAAFVVSLPAANQSAEN